LVTIIKLIKIRISIIYLITLILMLNRTKEDHQKIIVQKITIINRVLPNIKNHFMRQHLKFKNRLIFLKILRK